MQLCGCFQASRAQTEASQDDSIQELAMAIAPNRKGSRPMDSLQGLDQLPEKISIAAKAGDLQTPVGPSAMAGIMNSTSHFKLQQCSNSCCGLLHVLCGVFHVLLASDSYMAAAGANSTPTSLPAAEANSDVTPNELNGRVQVFECEHCSQVFMDITAAEAHEALCACL